MEPHRATTVLVLGILSIVLCQAIGPFAWAMGNKDLAKMASGLMDPSGMDQTNAGKICGIIGTVLMILGAIFTILYFVVIFVFVGAAAASGNM